MTRTWSCVAQSLALLGLVALAGCGHRHVVARYAPSHPVTSAVSVQPVASPVPPASPTAVTSPSVVAPARFGDAHPVAWPGDTPAALPVHGIDVSRYQTDIDWHTARAHGVSFAFIKATEGGDWADPALPIHWISAGAAGVPRGAYHFYFFCRSAEEQAAWFIANVPKEQGALPPVVDLEWNHLSRKCPDRPDTETVLSEVQTYLNIVGQHYDQQPIVYTTPDFWEHNQLWRLDGAQPWLRSVAVHPSERYPGEQWTFWQYSGTGLVPGIDGPVDLNAFAGTPTSWAAWLATNTQ